MSNESIRNFHCKKYEVNLTVDTSALASGDVASDRVAITLVTSLPAGTPVRGEIVGITLLDKDDEGSQLDLVFLDADKSLGTLNAAASISDSDAEALLAVVPITTYTDLGGCQVARPSFDPIPFETSTGIIYVGAISRGTPTYAAATDLRLKLFIRLHNVNL